MWKLILIGYAIYGGTKYNLSRKDGRSKYHDAFCDLIRANYLIIGNHWKINEERL
jgi:hypothetical protein